MDSSIRMTLGRGAIGMPVGGIDWSVHPKGLAGRWPKDLITGNRKQMHARAFRSFDLEPCPYPFRQETHKPFEPSRNGSPVSDPKQFTSTKPISDMSRLSSRKV
jgi:hypothetical protein